MSVITVQDLRPSFGAIRDQGSRPTCIAFAMSDAHAATRDLFRPFSVEHLYYHAIQRTLGGHPDDGVNMPTIIEALELDGQCEELGWPYQQVLPHDISTWRPPATARLVLRHDSVLYTYPAMTILKVLDDGWPIVLVFRMSKQFYTPINDKIVPDPSDTDVGYHAVVVVGHGIESPTHYLMIRNSWGNTWGFGGHAWISMDYFNPRIIAFAVMTKRRIVK